MFLEINHLDAFYGRLQALWDVSVSIEQSEIVALIGSNGAGKSTFLKSIAGSIRRLNGEIIFKEQNIMGWRPDKVVRAGIVMAPEGRQVFPRLSVQENLRIGGFVHKNSELDAGYERVFELFPILKERASQMAGTLSGGEQQMLAIGRALMGKPSLLMLDEPSLGLSPLFTEKIFELVLEIQKQGVTIILVEQNAVMALSIADRGYIIKNGRVVASDTGAKLLKSPEVIDNYLGRGK